MTTTGSPRDEALRILVVDDDQVAPMAVRRALRAGGVQAEIREAADVDSALAETQAREAEIRFRTVDELISTVQPLAESRGTELDVRAGDCVLPITTDSRRLRQILLNLVLPISKRLADLLGGELDATSTPGAGSVFRLRLPAPQLTVSTPSP